MDELFNILASSARIDKSKNKSNKKQKRKRKLHQDDNHNFGSGIAGGTNNDTDDDTDVTGSRGNVGSQSVIDNLSSSPTNTLKSRDRTGKRDLSKEKRLQVHKEQMTAFRRSVCIRLATHHKHEQGIPDAVPTFADVGCPSWWMSNEINTRKGSSSSSSSSSSQSTMVSTTFAPLYRAILSNIEKGRWKEPTPIQMQALPTLLERRDMIGCAPTGSGKSGAFLIPALLLSSAPTSVFYVNDSNDNNNSSSSSSSSNGDGERLDQQYGQDHHNQDSIGNADADTHDNAATTMKKRKKQKKDKRKRGAPSQKGQIRALVLAPSRELASQLHREVERLGVGKPNGGLTSLLLQRSNAAHVLQGTAGGKRGLDVLVTTPLRLIDAMEKGLSLDAVRFIVLDEADRLLDATDNNSYNDNSSNSNTTGRSIEPNDTDSDDDDKNDMGHPTGRTTATTTTTGTGAVTTSGAASVDPADPKSGSYQTQTFLSQMDSILSGIPASATRALFSATVTPTVKILSESILRNPLDVSIVPKGNGVGGANQDISQELLFVGREEGKLLALRQMTARGEWKPPCLIFCQSQERAQALFAEMLYDGLRMDVLHAGRSASAREKAVQKFRKGETWILICTDLVARGVDFAAVHLVVNYDLPTSGVTYIHRIGRTGRAGRKGKAITLFTEDDFDQLRSIANVMKQSGCDVPEWMLTLKKKAKKRTTTTARRSQGQKGQNGGRGFGHNRSTKSNGRSSTVAPRRMQIDTTPSYDKMKRHKKYQSIQSSKRKKLHGGGTGNGDGSA